MKKGSFLICLSPVLNIPFCRSDLLAVPPEIEGSITFLPVTVIIAVLIFFLLLGISLGVLVERRTKFLQPEFKPQSGEDAGPNEPVTEPEPVSTEEELRLLNATKDKFFSIIAHDLKNPFNSLLGFSDLLMNDFEQYDKEEIRRFIRIIHESSKHGFTLLENLLQWSRAQSGRIAFIPEKINLRDIIKGCVDLLQIPADKKEISIYQDIPNDIEIIGDLEMLSTVFRNLLSNAIKFTPERGRIKIRARNLPQRVEISIIDTGIGIPEEKIPDLFRIDKQVSTLGTNNEKGTGLGLILCKEFVDKHKGLIKVTSERKNGSEFKVILPAGFKKQERNGRKQFRKTLVEAG